MPRVFSASIRRPSGTAARLEAALALLQSESARRAAAETNLRRARAEAAAARRTADQAENAKAKFLAAASHDLRQPVQALCLLTEAIRTRLQGRPEVGVVEHMQHSLDALTALLDGLLEVSRLDAGLVRPVPQRVRLAPLLAEAVAVHGAAAEARRLRLRVVPGTLTVISDPALLGRMLHDVLDNAVRFTPRGGIVVGCRRHGRWAAIEVYDTGVGIPERHLGQVFEDFYQVANPERDRSKGLGLGLAVVRRLSGLLDHRVTIRSVEGRGTSVRIRLPIAPVPPA